MKNKDLVFDRNVHVLYSKECEKILKKKIALHYKKEQINEIWEKIQLQYVDFLKDWRTDLKGKENFHNGKGGTYDCIAIFAYYVVLKDVTTFKEIEEIEEELVLPNFKKLKFVNCNKMIFKKLMYKAFCIAKKNCDKYNDYIMEVKEFDKDKPIYYEFTSCPVAEFAIKHNLEEITGALCNVDYKSMELIHAKLIRTSTCVFKNKCDYTIVGDKDEYIKDHPEYIDENGFRRNK